MKVTIPPGLTKLCNGEGARYPIDSLYLDPVTDGYRLIATNSAALACVAADVEKGDDKPLVIPAEVVPEADELIGTVITVSRHKIRRCTNATTRQTAEENARRFPNYRNVLPDWRVSLPAAIVTIDAKLLATLAEVLGGNCVSLLLNESEEDTIAVVGKNGIGAIRPMRNDADILGQYRAQTKALRQDTKKTTRKKSTEKTA